MADNENDFEDYRQEAYHDVKKSRFQAFKDFFNRQKALPESTESKHKTTNVDMRTSMSLASFRAGLVERVGNFFEAISRIGSPKKDENLNKFAKEVVGAQDEKDKQTAVEKSLDDATNEATQSRQPRYFPGNVAFKNAPQAPSQGTVIIAETEAVELDNELEHDSVDEVTNELDKDFTPETNSSVEASKLEATTMHVAKQPEIIKPVEIKTSSEKTPKKSNEKDGPEL